LSVAQPFGRDERPREWVAATEMLTVGQQKIDVLTLLLLLLLIGAAAVAAVAQPKLMPWVFVGVAGLAVFAYWAARWEITLWAWIWVLSYGLLDWPEWKVPIPGFFTMTVPRFIFVGAVFVFGLHFLLRKQLVRMDRLLLWIMLALTVYVGLNAWNAGWESSITELRSAPYFRFIGAIMLPLIMFFLVYNCVSREEQIQKALILITVYGWFALYIGYLQFAAIHGLGEARAFIWPPYINNPEYGIHFDRARGAFIGAGPQAVFLVLLFYVDLFLIRRLKGPYRAALVVQALLVPPAVFFAGLRSAYLAFLLCGLVWVLASKRWRFAMAKLGVAGIVVAASTFVLWSNLTTRERARGGVAQMTPIEARKLLALQTWRVFQEHPVFGVGFGHWAEAQMKLEDDPSSLGAMTTGVLVEHNLFLTMVAETGVIGLVGTILLFVLVFRQSMKLYRKLPPTASGTLCRGFVVLFWVALVNFLTDAMFRDTLWDIFANGMFWSLAALVVGYNRLLEPHPLDLSPAVGDTVR